jgi:hypothetical protein
VSRVFWFTVGAGSGVLAMVKTRRAAERFTPSGVRDQLAAARFGLRLLGEEVVAGMADHETRLRARLLTPHPETPFTAITPAPITPAPITPAPITPAPITQAPITPAPITPAPITQAPREGSN